MNVCFIAAGPVEWGSSRMRVHWVAPYVQDSQVILYDSLTNNDLPPADVYVWQKHAYLEKIRKTPQATHIWDICDPMWWYSPNESRMILEYMDALVFSCKELQDDFLMWYEGDRVFRHITTIEDRLDPSHYPMKREHKDVNPLRFIWFGMAQNRIALYGAMANLDRLAANGYKFELTIFDDRPELKLIENGRFPAYNIKWTLQQENEVIASHDVALLPPYPGPWGKVKSNNRQLTAWSCGLPVVSGFDYTAMQMMFDPKSRADNVPAGDWLNVAMLSQKSGELWEDLICSL